MTPVVLVRGDDPGLRGRALADAVARLLGGDDRSLAVAEFEVPESAEERPALVGAILDAARTPPFGTARRIVVARAASRLAADDARALAQYLAAPSPDAVLVLEVDGRLPPGLAKACKEAGAEEVGEARAATVDVLVAEAQRAGIVLDQPARERVLSRIGNDAGRIPALLELLAGAYGEGAHLTATDVEAYLGEEGAVPLFRLTAAIEEGAVPEALAILERMLGPMGMHPLQLMALLHNHYRRVLRLDDPRIRNEQDAVEALGGAVKAYPAKKAWTQARRLGTDGLREAFGYLARADVELRGGGVAALPEPMVMELLVTRLATLSRRVGAGERGAGRRRSRS